MGASDSKLVFKRGIFRLSEERHIPADDAYWTSFWELPESSEDVFSLFTPADIRRTRDRALENLETLILAITSRLFILRHHPSFPDPELAPEREALNCIRVLTRILPYLYEKESLSDWEQQFFWAQRRKRTRHGAIANEILFDEAQEAERKTQTAEFEEVKPLAEELVDTLVDLLFFSDLTLPRQPNGRPKTLKYNPATWRVPYNTLVFKAGKQMLVTYSLQFLLVLLLYPIPENPENPSPKHSYRHFLGRLHRPQDFQFIVDGMTRILNQPLQEKTSYLPGSQSSGHFAPEILMLFWEILQCNKRFRSFIVDTERAHDFVVLALFYALEYKNDATKQGVVRMCAFLLQTLSVETNFGVNLNKYFEGQESLPMSIRVPGFRGTYADFLIHSIYNLITTSQGKLSAIYPALLAQLKTDAAVLFHVLAFVSTCE
ncbi:Hid-1/Ecm30 [Fusarium oxysporum f. sp. vasinfectum]|nr:Hid-1/Ecm30 [Fusarium oxysporum f. sp. vasinfectum]